MKVLNKCDFRNSYFSYLCQSICFHYKNKRHYVNKDQGAGTFTLSVVGVAQPVTHVL